MRIKFFHYTILKYLNANFKNEQASGNCSIIFTNNNWLGWKSDPGKLSGPLKEANLVTETS